MWISVQPSQLAPLFDLCYRLSECNPSSRGPNLVRFSTWTFKMIPIHSDDLPQKPNQGHCFFLIVIVIYVYSYYSCIPTCSHVPTIFLVFFPTCFLINMGSDESTTHCRHRLCSPGQRALQTFLPQFIHREFLRQEIWELQWYSPNGGFATLIKSKKC